MEKEDIKAAYVFPGQGSQEVGMGRELYKKFSSSRQVFSETDEALGFRLSKLIFEGPEEELTRTLNVQPAILTVSIACMKAAQEVGLSLPYPKFLAGHSLGEYTALVAARALSLSEAVLLVRERGRLMNLAGEIAPSGMLAVIGARREAIEELCSRSGAEISNINSPGQIVVSGALSNLEKFKEEAKALGHFRIIPLRVSAAFHSRLMDQVAEPFSKYLEQFSLRDPEIPIIGNVAADILNDAQSIKKELVAQLRSCVQWQKSVEKMITLGVNTFIEIGHGEVLSGLIKRIDTQVRIEHIGDDL